MRITDYKSLSVGTKVDDGEIQKCPHCGQNGLAETVGGKTYYTHYQTFGFSEAGQPVIEWRFCPMPMPPSFQTKVFK